MIELSIRRPILVIVVFATLSVLAALSITRLNIELLPEFNAPVVTISTIYPGAGPAEVENGITKVVEDAIASLNKIREIRSVSVANFSAVTVAMEQDISIDKQLQEAQRRINLILNDLPQGARTPIVSKISSDEFPIMNIGATSKLPPTEFYQLMQDRVLPAINRRAGVGQVEVLGGRAREIRVSIKSDQLEKQNVSILQILQAIRTANLEFPTGKVQNQDEEVLIQLSGRFKSLEDLRQLVVFQGPTGAPVKLYQVAEVRDAEEEVTDINRVNGQNAIGLAIIKRADANAVEVSERVRQALGELQTQYRKEQLQFAIATDTSEFTLEAVRSVLKDLLLAILLVAAVMLLFLHSFRNALIVMISIPASLLLTIIVMGALDYTFNVLTLLAMSLVIGILVDDSIVVLENIFRHLEMGKTSRMAAKEGAQEILWTAMSITLVLVVVFLPLIFSTGLVAIIMRQFAVVVTVSIAMSLFVSYTVAPALSSRISRLERFREGSLAKLVFGNFEAGIYRLSEQYGRLLDWSLRHPWLVIGASLILIAGSTLLITGGYIGTAFLNTGDRGEFIVQLELPKNASFRETNKLTQRAEAYLLRQPEVENVFTLVGRQTGFLGRGQNSPNLAEFTLKLVPQDEREVSTAVYAAQTKNALSKILPGVQITSNEITFFGGTGDTPIQVIVSSTNYERARDYADRLLVKLKNTEGVTQAELAVGEGVPRLSVRVNRARLADFGLDLQMVGGTLATAFSGNTDAKYREGGREYDINIRLDAFDRRSREDIANLTVMNRKGQMYKVSQFAEIVPTTGPARLERNDRVPAVRLQSQVLGRPSGSIGLEIQEWVAQNPPPADVIVEYGGDLKRQSDAFSDLGIVFVASILFVYFILVALYDSFLDPVIVMFSIPVAGVGALLAMALTMEPFNVFSIIGIIMLNGLVAKNAILLVDFANQARAGGLSTFDALVQAGRIRLRPILMTAISLIVGMIPIAVAGGAAAEWKNGLAWVIIGGLTSSTFFTLLLVPVIYKLTHRG